TRMLSSCATSHSIPWLWQFSHAINQLTRDPKNFKQANPSLTFHRQKPLDILLLRLLTRFPVDVRLPLPLPTCLRLSRVRAQVVRSDPLVRNVLRVRRFRPTEHIREIREVVVGGRASQDTETKVTGLRAHFRRRSFLGRHFLLVLLETGCVPPVLLFRVLPRFPLFGRHRRQLRLPQFRSSASFARFLLLPFLLLSGVPVRRRFSVLPFTPGRGWRWSAVTVGGRRHGGGKRKKLLFPWQRSHPHVLPRPFPFPHVIASFFQSFIRLRPDLSGSVRTSSVLRSDPRIRLSSFPDTSSELRLASVSLAVASDLGR
ncbi:hypothetical protein K438DRAFT_1816063, partial [Mycena galopus ATCC 62051]